MTNEAKENPAAARLIVSERKGRWAVALRRELTGAGIRVLETRDLDDAWNELAASPASFVVLEASANVEPLLRHLATLHRDFPAARAAVVADRAWVQYEWLLREAGAVHFLCSTRQVAPLAKMACRHLAQVPPPRLSLTERVWASLPWA